jgi:hypothetical protein
MYCEVHLGAQYQFIILGICESDFKIWEQKTYEHFKTQTVRNLETWCNSILLFEAFRGLMLISIFCETGETSTTMSHVRL